MSDLIIQETEGAVRIIRLNRPQALNALCRELIQDLNEALDEAEVDSKVRVIVLTGSEKAFAAGADIREMKDLRFSDVFANDFIAPWERLAKCRKPVIAAVSGYALGGGCELAMMCDMIIASDTAKFSQPEITIGTTPGAGGTQRLTRLVGRTRAMELCLTGRMIDASEADRIGLVIRVVQAAELIKEAVALAEKIASYSAPVVQMVKEAVNRADETTLSEGIRFERRLFQSTFALDDRQEGMAAFAEKRPPKFQHG